jgi:hypothetical protein
MSARTVGVHFQTICRAADAVSADIVLNEEHIWSKRVQVSKN